MICQNIRSVVTRVHDIGRSKPEWVDGTVRHSDRTYYIFVDRRLHCYGYGRIYDLGVDAGLQA